MPWAAQLMNKPFELLPLRVDIDAIRQTLTEHIFKLGKPIFQGDEYGYNNFGGWSLLSRTGRWEDGWEIGHTGHPGEQLIFPNGQPNYKAAKFLEISDPFEHKNPTEACVGPIADALRQLDEMGFYPRRARVSLLRPGGATLLHSDAPRDRYMARIHIPIITNPACIHNSDGFPFHMPADGSVYMLWVNVPHIVRNDSTIDRYHIIMDAYDTKGITEQFKYSNNIDDLERRAQSYRDSINAVALTENDIAYFNQVKQQFLKNTP